MKWLKRIAISLIGLVIGIIILYLLGPKADFVEVNNIPSKVPRIQLEELNEYISLRESKITNLKADNQARVVWYDSIQQTDYAFVYLHGFSASQGEGSPMHRNVARHFGANLYLARLRGHGIQGNDIFLNLAPTQLVEDAKDAIAIGKLLGKEVIVMSCSTGGTLSLYLSAGDPDIKAQILASPNVALFNPIGRFLNNPWGLRPSRWSGGGEENVIPYDSASLAYWTGRYRWEGVVALQELLEQTMHREVFGAITQPVFCAYYFKNEDEQDMVISVDAIREMEDQISTPSSLQHFEAFDNGTNHVLISPLKNPNWLQVQESIISFCEDVLDMNPLD